ncbi:phage tail tape measure protein [Fusobacterium ulcerans]|uniref:phage tail tape measure protein n=1 Tax=Fusobacterium ulcerans TaxID=861 RepID=UPI0030A465D1
MAGKIAGIYYEVDYKINPQGFQKANDNIKRIDGNAKGAANQIGFLDKGMGNLIGKAAGIVSIGYAFKKTSDLIGQSVVAYTEFDDSLRKTGSKLNLTDADMKNLAKSTRSVALEFNSTAKAVSDAQEYLALAGYNLEEIQAASPTVVAAQRATGESMQLVSDIATDTASSYGYMANEIDFVTDRMVYTTTAFNTNFAQMGEAMKYVAPVAKNAGLEFADLNAYIGVAANSGIKASQAGTALRAMFLRIQAPSKMAAKQLRRYNIQLYDNKGKFIGVNNAMALMEKKMGTMTEKQKAFFMQQVFGTEAMSTANIIFKEGIDNIIAYGDAIDGANGKTSQMAKYMEAGIGGMIRSLDSQKDSIKLTLGDAFEPVAYEFVKTLRDGAKEFNEVLENSEGLNNIIKVGMGLAEIIEGIKWVGENTNNIIEGLNLGPTFKVLKGISNFWWENTNINPMNPLQSTGNFLSKIGENRLMAQGIDRRWMREGTDILTGGSKAASNYVMENFGIKTSEEMNFLNSKSEIFRII